MNKLTYRTIILTLVLCLVMMVPALAEGFTPGTYEATVDSVGGPLTVAVTVSEDRIEEVTIVENHDTDGVCDVPMARIPQEIIDNQSINVDSVSGATLTSIFLKNAVKDALAQATDDLAPYQEKVAWSAPAQSDMDVDVVVVGGGISGMAAAVNAAANGKKVVVLEKLAIIGGDALISNGWIGLIDDPASIDALAAAGVNIQNIDGQMASLTIDIGEKSVIHELMDEFRAIIEDKGGLVLTDTPAIGLVNDGKAVSGVIAQPKGQDAFRINAPSVVLASGGFACNPELVEKYLPYAAGARSTGLPGKTGDALAWIGEVDGQTRELDNPVSSFYAVSPTTGYMSEFSFVPANFIDANGDLITELKDYNKGAMACYEAVGRDTFYTVVTQAEVEAGYSQAIFDHMEQAKSVFKYEGMDAVMEAYGMPNLKETLTGLGYGEDEVFYVGPSTAAIYGTWGGIQVDDGYRVLNSSNEAVPGLYAIGNAIGGAGNGAGMNVAYGVVNSIMADVD